MNDSRYEETRERRERPTGPERITIRWAGKTEVVDVVKRFKNGRIKVEVPDRGDAWEPGHRYGWVRPTEYMTVEPWQVVEEESHEPAEG